jgi:aminoglycoside 2'-N-acetyltransferase I
MPALRVAHTADLDEATLTEVRALMDAAFDEFEDTDWQHALGGMHVLIEEDGEVIGHASVVQRRVIAAGRTLRCGYVEAVAVRGDRRRRGHGGTLMHECGRLVRGGYHVGALGATDDGAPLYTAHGWKRWEGPAFALTPDGVERTPEEEGYIYVLEVDGPLDLTGELTCDWREGDVW